MAAGKSDAPFTLTRTFDAPREAVFRAFTEARAFAQWWGPAGAVVENLRMDARAGGTTHYALSFPDGGTMWARKVYWEIVPHERLIWVNSFSDAAGALARGAGHEAWPLQILNVVTLDEVGGRTRLTLTSSPLDASAEEIAVFDGGRASMAEGWGGTFDRLDAHLGKGCA